MSGNTYVHLHNDEIDRVPLPTDAPKKARRPQKIVYSFEHAQGYLSEPALPGTNGRVNEIFPFVTFRKDKSAKKSIAEQRELNDPDVVFAEAKNVTRITRYLKSDFDPNRATASTAYNLDQKYVIEWYVALLAPLIEYNNDTVICAAPTSTPANVDRHGITQIAKLLALETGNIDGTDLVKRIAAKKPAHKRGKNSRAIVLQDLFVDQESFEGRNVLLLEDVVKTGTTAESVQDAIYAAGAQRVSCLALCRVFTNANVAKTYQGAMQQEILNIISKQPKYANEPFDVYNAMLATKALFPNKPPTAEAAQTSFGNWSFLDDNQNPLCRALDFDGVLEEDKNTIEPTQEGSYQYKRPRVF